ncbi:Rieske (2Fe-2S) protein [Sandarakinorhabdus sp. DWP1-3-1]|uniref:Rieske (2Fe-2S) protein n=1 Tax=Sandarakinorhabdus sp. DWP1-3-1 TaxID=2804627 RepID=UPI003CE80A2C
MSDPPENWQDAGLADLAPAALQCRMVGAARVLIVRDAAGSWFAMAPDCSHAALSLEGGRVRGSAIMCPHHGARFDLKTGRHLGPPAWTGIATWPVRVVGDRVEVLL